MADEANSAQEQIEKKGESTTVKLQRVAYVAYIKILLCVMVVLHVTDFFFDVYVAYCMWADNHAEWAYIILALCSCPCIFLAYDYWRRQDKGMAFFGLFAISYFFQVHASWGEYDLAHGLYRECDVFALLETLPQMIFQSYIVLGNHFSGRRCEAAYDALCMQECTELPSKARDAYGGADFTRSTCHSFYNKSDADECWRWYAICIDSCVATEYLKNRQRIMDKMKANAAGAFTSLSTARSEETVKLKKELDEVTKKLKRVLQEESGSWKNNGCSADAANYQQIRGSFKVPPPKNRFQATWRSLFGPRGEYLGRVPVKANNQSSPYVRRQPSQQGQAMRPTSLVERLEDAIEFEDEQKPAVVPSIHAMVFSLSLLVSQVMSLVSSLISLAGTFSVRVVSADLRYTNTGYGVFTEGMSWFMHFTCDAAAMAIAVAFLCCAVTGFQRWLPFAGFALTIMYDFYRRKAFGRVLLKRRMAGALVHTIVSPLCRIPGFPALSAEAVRSAITIRTAWQTVFLVMGMYYTAKADAFGYRPWVRTFTVNSIVIALGFACTMLPGPRQVWDGQWDDLTEHKIVEGELRHVRLSMQRNCFEHWLMALPGNMPEAKTGTTQDGEAAMAATRTKRPTAIQRADSAII